jgi:hypothetical protein
MLSVIYVKCRKIGLYAECHYSECRYASAQCYKAFTGVIYALPGDPVGLTLATFLPQSNLFE